MKTSRKLLFGKTLLIAFVSTILITTLLVYFTGLSSHRSIIDNSIISLSILSFSLFSFLFIGLYNGLNIMDNYSHKLKLYWKSRTGLNKIDLSTATEISSFTDVGEGIEGILLSIVLWILFTLVWIIILFLLPSIIWLSIILLIAAIYWIMIRGLKLIFSKSTECQGQLVKSMFYAINYTIVYVRWLYGLIYISALF